MQYLNVIVDLAGSATTVMSSTFPSNGPLISQDITVTANQFYNVQLEVMLTDLDSSSEYADISINGINVGRCNPSSGQGSCNWYTCTLSPSQVSSTNTILTIQLQYSSAVNDFAVCTFEGHTGHAVARVTLTAGKKEHSFQIVVILDCYKSL